MIFVSLLLKKELSSPPIEGGSDQFSISYDGKLLAFSVHTKNREMAWTTKWDIYLIDLTKTSNPVLGTYLSVNTYTGSNGDAVTTYSGTVNVIALSKKSEISHTLKSKVR